MKKILIVDDEDHIRALVSATIGIGTYEVFEAKNGDEAIEVARREKPDLIFLDIGMPRMDGFEVCRRLREDPVTSSAHITILTAYGQDEDKKRSTEVGADDYFIKPFSPTALLDKVTDVLEKTG
ncbi:MAG: response regulator [Thermodesulfobacteriota bacterium]